ncbi:MAG: CheW protein [Candidatus Nitrotoga sp. SPKER]|nr:MAG: CheW protein [Candidatus Nitrotoga sp. SPKER]
MSNKHIQQFSYNADQEGTIKHHSPASDMDRLVVFTLNDQRYALPLTTVDRVVRMVCITPLPKAPDIILGIVNVQGRVIPVINMRRRFYLPEREIILTDQLVIAHTALRPVALVVDAVLDVFIPSAEVIIEAQNVLFDAEYIKGVVKLSDGLILIQDLDKFLSQEEEISLSLAMATV